MENKKVEVYSGKYLEVPYEIRHWHYSDGTPQWNYYIFLIEKQIPVEFKKLWLPAKKISIGGSSGEHIFYDYNNTVISSLDWHCGCTYYEKVSGIDGADRVIKVGCDYAHLYDENKNYTLMDIERDTMNCIESLVSKVNVLKWCSHCGGYSQEVNEKRYCLNCQKREQA